jgi:hypothetical protein
VSRCRSRRGDDRTTTARDHAVAYTLPDAYSNPHSNPDSVPDHHDGVHDTARGAVRMTPSRRGRIDRENLEVASLLDGQATY